jgi:hypothetical protein
METVGSDVLHLAGAEHQPTARAAALSDSGELADQL